MSPKSQPAGSAELHPRERSQESTFDAFLRTQPYEIRPGWKSRGLTPPIDFINIERRIGVELTEWRGQEESEWVEQRDDFRAAIFEAIEEQGLKAFSPGGGRFTAEIYLQDGPPGRRHRRQVIAALLSFLDNFVRTAGPSRFRPFGTASVPPPELPETIKRWVNSITVYIFPPGNLGVVVRRKTTIFDPALTPPTPKVALNSFRHRLVQKCVTGSPKYAQEKSRLQLDQLWLAVHYSSPGVFPEPMTELQMDIGYGEHRHASQRAVAEKLKPIAQAVGAGPFDRIYFLVDCQPDPFSQLIFLK